MKQNKKIVRHKRQWDFKFHKFVFLHFFVVIAVEDKFFQIMYSDHGFLSPYASQNPHLPTRPAPYHLSLTLGYKQANKKETKK